MQKNVIKPQKEKEPPPKKRQRRNIKSEGKQDFE